jgi:hypothetical protein
MRENIQSNLLLISIIILSILFGSLLTIAYDNHRLNKYTEQTILIAQDVMDTCKANYFQDYKMTELETKYVIEVIDE